MGCRPHPHPSPAPQGGGDALALGHADDTFPSMVRIPRVLLVTLIVCAATACTQPAEQSNRCRSMPDTEGRRVAEEALRAFILEHQSSGSPTGPGTLHEVVEGVDPNNLRYLGRPQQEPGDDVLVFEFQNAGRVERTFGVLVSDECATEINWSN